MSTEIHIDALLPAEMARRAELLGVRKAEMKLPNMLALSLLAGAFIGLGAAFATTISAGTSGTWPYGVTRLLTGLVFCLGLVLVIVGGAELFTGNNPIVMAWASKKVTTTALLRNWVIVYLGNFIGSLGTALVIFLGKQYTFGSGAVGMAALTIANSKVHLDFIQAIALGIMCNAMVCLAVWMSYSCRSVTDKILAIIFPISGFVAAGFEHSVANMYFIPYALFVKQLDPAFVAGLGDKVHLDGLTWGAFLLNNLLPVTIGNIIGGALLVGGVYWLVYLAKRVKNPG
jgi:formate/nitrite transporter